MKINLIITFSIFLSFTACTEEIAGPTEYLFPEKLYPYEDNYSAEEFSARRDRLLEQLPDSSMVIITTNDIYVRNSSIEYQFRPSSLFYYLTGFDEPSAFAILRKSGESTSDTDFILFVEERTSSEVQWQGEVAGVSGAMEYFHADTAYDSEEFWHYVSSNDEIRSGLTIFNNFEENEQVADRFATTIGTQIPMESVKPLVDDLRLIKSSLEIDLIQRSIDVTIQSFEEMLNSIEANKYEYEMQAIMDYVARANGCPRTAYPAIIASGPNINVLHYSTNERKMLDGELVMIDYGAEYGYYACDLTRTLPVNGKFTIEQRTVYEIVLEAHKAVIEMAAPGVNYYYLYVLEVEMIIDGLLANDIITGTREEILSSGRYRQYIVGGLGHCIGLDVHDPFPKTGQYEKLLQENMVLAFEPHIYLYEGDVSVDPDYWNVSARIEDDVLITGSGSQVLSKDLPNEISELEAMFD